MMDVLILPRASKSPIKITCGSSTRPFERKRLDTASSSVSVTLLTIARCKRSYSSASQSSCMHMKSTLSVRPSLSKSKANSNMPNFLGTKYEQASVSGDVVSGSHFKPARPTRVGCLFRYSPTLLVGTRHRSVALATDAKHPSSAQATDTPTFKTFTRLPPVSADDAKTLTCTAQGARGASTLPRIPKGPAEGETCAICKPVWRTAHEHPVSGGREGACEHHHQRG